MVHLVGHVVRDGLLTPLLDDTLVNKSGRGLPAAP